MEKAYERFVQRKTQRRNAFKYFVAYLVFLIVVGVYVFYNASWFYFIWVTIGMFSSVFYFIYLMSRPWAGENYETKIFVDFYDATKLLELVSDKDENSLLYSKKAAKKLEEAIQHIGSIAYRLEQVNSTFVNKKLAQPFRILENNIRIWILPRVSEQKNVQEMISVLHGLALLFSETTGPLSLDEIISKNEALKRFEIAESKKEPNRIRVLLSKESVKLSYSIFFGFIIVFAVVLGHSMLYKYNVAESLNNLTNFLGVLAVGVAIGLGIYEIRKRK